MARPQVRLSRPEARMPFVSALHPTVADEGALDRSGWRQWLTGLPNCSPQECACEWRVLAFSRPWPLRRTFAMLSDDLGQDGVTTDQVAFDWMLAQGLVRSGERDVARLTAGIDEAPRPVHSKRLLSAATYLKPPTILGFHGVCHLLATNFTVIDDDYRLDRGESRSDVQFVW